MAKFNQLKPLPFKELNRGAAVCGRAAIRGTCRLMCWNEPDLVAVCVISHVGCYV